MPYYYYFDPTYILVILGFLICLIFSAIMKSTFSKYSRVRSVSGYDGRMTAERILNENGISNVGVCEISGSLTDHYDPSSKMLRLSQSVYDNHSIAAIGVAAHECGHAIQDARGYTPLVIRSAIVPIVNICSNISWIFIIIGLVVTGSAKVATRHGYVSVSSLILTIGIILFSATVIFQFVTLPVEINASKRGLAILKNTGILNNEELEGAKKVLTAAAFTYIASTISAILSLLRIILLSRRRND